MPFCSIRRTRPPRLALAAVALLVLCLAAACTRSRSGGIAPPNVVLVVIDTLRADHVGCYGAARSTTPGLDALAASGVRFARAYSPAPWTKPAVASILTGLYPSGHGATNAEAKLPEKVSTLAEILAARGYVTGAVVSASFLSSKFGLDQGFGLYDESQIGDYKTISTPGVTRRALAFARDAVEKGRPFFLFAHYFDPHHNYRRHPQFGFAPARAGRLTGAENIRELRAMLESMTTEEIAFLRSLYDEEIAFTDAGVARLLNGIMELGAYQNTLVVVVADHGEEFLERGWLGHTRTLYGELLSVPLILRLPASVHAGRVVQVPVSTVSITPTILDLLRVERPDLKFQRGSLAGLLAEGDQPAPDVLFAEVDFTPLFFGYSYKSAFKKALIGPRYKLIRDDRSGVLELYDLMEDPREKHDLASERDDLVRQLRPLLQLEVESAKKGASPAGKIELSPEQLERLRNLGYGG